MEPITEEEVRRQLMKLKKGKGDGEDWMPNEASLKTPDNVIRRMSCGRMKAYQNREVKGYHARYTRRETGKKLKSLGITLLNTRYKQNSMVLRDRLEKGTLDNVYIFHHGMGKGLQKKEGIVFALFVDLKAVFDIINREKKR